MKKEILLYMSDQHSHRLQGWAGDSVVRTPMMDRLAREGTAMTNAMTSCPLCVPARASLISGQLPSNNGVLFNFNAISSDQATFLHSLTASGYETVLCGRMYFVGPDQRHGYARHIAGDRTPVFHNNPPVPPELYDYYLDKVSLEDVKAPDWEHPALAGKMRETDPEVVRAARAAYYGLTETVDRNMEMVYNAFQDYLRRTGREGIFIYISDHGDMNGNRGYFGKQVFYDPSVHIPFLMAGSGIPAGKRIESPVSLLDVGPTICQLAGAEVLPGDGKSLAPLLEGGEDPDRMVVSEQYTYLAAGGSSLGRMVRWKNWKFVTYSGFSGEDLLFDMEKGPGELENVIARHPDTAACLRKEAEKYRSYEQVMEHERWVLRQLRVLMACDYEDTVSNPRSIREIELEATFVISASCSWVMPRSLRIRCIACPPCLKSTAIPPTSMFHPYYERTRRVNSRTLWTKLDV